MNKKIKNFYKHQGALMLSLAIIIAGSIFALLFLLPKGERINSGGYQVVYMSTGQAYFGKLKNTDGDYLVLSTPYTAQDVKGEGENAQSSTTLIKVSQQQYGPDEAMSLKSEQVLFWQNLRSDSKVSQAIKNTK